MQAPFEIAERDDPDGRVRLTLTGELDLAVAGQLTDRLQQLRDQRRAVRLDLSRLEFIDSSGIHALINGAAAGHAEDEQLLEVESDLHPSVRRVIELLGIAPILWPNQDEGLGRKG